MARKSLTHQLTESILGQHLALSVAAHLARTQLVRDPLAVYDAHHMLEILNVVGGMLARVARLYVLDTQTGQPRELSEAEMEGATVLRAATVLVLKGGRTLSGVSIKRSDLRQAIAILKAVGIPELGIAHSPTTERQAAPSDRMEQLRSQLAELEELLRLPLVPAQAQRACHLAISMARAASQGRISNLAMQLMSAVNDALNGGDEKNVQAMLARLGIALREGQTA